MNDSWITSEHYEAISEGILGMTMSLFDPSAYPIEIDPMRISEDLILEASGRIIETNGKKFNN